MPQDTLAEAVCMAREFALITAQRRVLSSVARGAPLQTILDELLRDIERENEGMLCSILLLDPDGIHVRHGAAPSLPAEYVQAIDGEPIGPRAGSCGTAAFRRQAVVVEDIATDPLWAGYREVALGFGLRACWSTPILDEQGAVLGTFAIYYRQPARPDPWHQRIIELVTDLAAIALVRQRLDDERERLLAQAQAARQETVETHQRFAKVFERVSDGVVALDTEWRYTYVNQKAATMLGRQRPEDLIGKNIWEEYPESADQPFARAYREAIETQQARIIKEYYQPWDRWFENRIYPSADGLTIYFSEITEQVRTELALQESEERLRLALEAAHLGTFDWDLQQDRITWSRWHEELWGFAPGEFAGTYAAFAERVHPEDLPALDAEVARCLSAREPFQREFRVVWPDGSQHWVMGRGEFTFGPDGQALRMRGAVLETTERKRTELALRDSERRFRNVFDQAADGIFVLTPDHRFVDANAEGLRMLGYGREELLRLRLSDVLAEHERARLDPAMARMLAGVPHLQSWEHVRKDGSTFMAEVSAKPLSASEYLAVVRDITERQRAAEAVRDSEQRLRTVLDGLSPSMFVGLMTPDGVLLEANEPALRIANLGREQVVGQPLHETYWPSYSPDVQRRTQQAIERARTGETVRYDEVIRVGDESYVVIDFTLHPLIDPAGKLLYLVPSAVEITERKRMEDDLRRLSIELEQRVAERTAELVTRSSRPSATPFPTTSRRRCEASTATAGC
jgi:PAS domain S-box-containing protein